MKTSQALSGRKSLMSLLPSLLQKPMGHWSWSAGLGKKESGCSMAPPASSLRSSVWAASISMSLKSSSRTFFDQGHLKSRWDMVSSSSPQLAHNVESTS